MSSDLRRRTVAHFRTASRFGISPHLDHAVVQPVILGANSVVCPPPALAFAAPLMRAKAFNTHFSETVFPKIMLHIPNPHCCFHRFLRIAFVLLQPRNSEGHAALGARNRTMSMAIQPAARSSN